jgi:heptosyltransferase-2
MKIFIETPTWLGDTIMATPAIENIVEQHQNCELIIFGSKISTELFKYHPNVSLIIVDNTKEIGNRYLNLRKIAKSIGEVDISFSFKQHFPNIVLLFFINSNKKFRYKRYTNKLQHQVVRYNDFVNKSLFSNTKPYNLKIYKNDTIIPPKKGRLPILGINAGATYGGAKRWLVKEFAKVAIVLSSTYDIKIFGSPNEKKIAIEIENILKKKNIVNYTNLVGMTTVNELILHISTLDLFITNDTGPMHIAAAFQIPTVSIFGPTKCQETEQWKNQYNMIVKKDFKCMPCMKKECPLEGKELHQCMVSITSNDVLNKIYETLIAPTLKKKRVQKSFKKKYNIPKKYKLVLFKAKNFKQNGITSFFNIISKLNKTNFQAIVCGDDKSIKYAREELLELNISLNIIYLNDISVKTADIFLLPTNNIKFANNILNAMKESCAVFTPSTNEASQIIDIFSTMQNPNDINTAYKIDALLGDKKQLKTIQKENVEKSLYISN